MNKHEGDRQLIKVYVDDLIINGLNSSLTRDFKKYMMKLFKMIDLGHLFSYLGIDMIQDEDWICLNHIACSKKILETFKMDQCNP